jgi:hypothetical protein
VFKILSEDVDDQSSLVLRQSQIQLIKALTHLVEREFALNGTHSNFLQNLMESDEGEPALMDLLHILNRNASKPQLLKRNE